MKISVSNRIYFKPSEELWEHCRKQTTYHIFDKGSKFPKVYQNSGTMGGGLHWIPTTRLDILDSLEIPYTIIDRQCATPALIPRPTFALRDDQQEIADKIEGTCIINGKPGFGKTILALYLAHKFQLKTLIVCTTVGIREQWEREIVKHFGFKPGIIGSGKFDIDPPIVVSNIQTLNKRANELGRTFGMVIVDEMHHCPASTFSNFLSFSAAKIKIGLSGTLKRKDGLQVMFKDMFGFEIHSPKVNNTVAPTIHVYKIAVELSGNISVPWANRANDVYNNPIYRETVFDLCRLYAELGHQVLFVSDRTEVLYELAENLSDAGVSTEAITGRTSSSDRLDIMERIANGETNVLVASQSIFSEGISLDELSCLVLGSIVNNESLIEQLAGRIQRIVPGKLPPVFVDLNLKGGVAKNQGNARKGVYINNNWEYIDMTPEKLSLLLKTLVAES